MIKNNKIHLDPNFLQLIRQIKILVEAHDYQEILLPTITSLNLLQNHIETADIVTQKQMFYLSDTNYCLRPEGTFLAIDCLKAILKIKPYQKVYYCGPMFRKENTQKGRYHEFYQLGLEHIGYDQVIQICDIISASWYIFCQLNLEDVVELQINNIGSLYEREQYLKQLTDFCKTINLTSEQQHIVNRNPLRILDTKNLQLKNALSACPTIDKFIPYNQDYTSCLNNLDQLSIPYKINQNLVRGLDYYEGIVFEWIIKPEAQQILKLKDTICGGGQYNIKKMLCKELSITDTKALACGCGFGLERIMLLKQELKHVSTQTTKLIYLFGAEQQDWPIAQQVKDAYISQIYFNVAIRSDLYHLQQAKYIKAKIICRVKDRNLHIYDRQCKQFVVIDKQQLDLLIIS